VLHETPLEAVEHDPGTLDESITRLLHRDPEALELDAPEPATETEHEATAAHDVEDRHLLGDAHRVVPRAHDHHRPALHRAGAAGEVSEELQHVGTHRVRREV